MSLNAAISQEYLVQTEALLSLLEQYMTRWSSASTLEERLLIEADAVSTFERLIELQLYVDSVGVGQHPDMNDLGRVYSDWEFLLRLNSAKIQKLSETFLKRFNSQQMALMELTSIMKRIRQKRAALSLWTRDKAKYVLAEHFLNYDAIDTRFTSVKEADVDPNQGVLTLPIRNKNLLTPKTARIGSGSNGQPGNSDEDVQVNNANPVFAINQEEANWFEYERLDVGPVELDYVVEFTQPQIINQVVIEPVNLGLSLPFEVVDITFSTSGTEETSIHDLVTSEFDADFFTVKSVGNDTSWVLSHLPVQASVVTFKFKQRQSYPITVASTDDRTVQRSRFAIALKDIALYKVEYDSTGGINSKALDLPGGLYVALPFADIWPQNSSFFTEHLEVSLDGGATWTSTNIPLTPGDDPLTVLMQGTETSFLWRVTLERNDEAFTSLTSFIEEPDPLLERNSLQRGVSRFQSPTDIPLSETPLDGRVFVMQPKLARRGDRYKGISIGTGGGQNTSFELPFSLVKQGLKPDELRVFVARREYSRVEDNTVIGAYEWAYSDDFREILFGSALPNGSDIRIVFSEEKLVLEERSDGYYHQMKLLFDPDKENIDLKYLPRNSIRETIILPRDQTTIPLGTNNLISDSFVLSSTDGVTYTEVTSRADVLDAQDTDYYVDYINGVLYLASELGSDIVKATYLHQTEQDINSDSYSIVMDGNRPWGIRINKNSLIAQQKSETVSSTPGQVISILDGTYTARTDAFANVSNAKMLTYDCVVKGSLSVTDNLLNTSTPPEEVEFMDGHSEFLGLIPMNSEETVEIDADSDFVQFSLSARSLWYEPLGVVFTDGTVFANEVSSESAAKSGSVGDYYVSPEGEITVNVGSNGTLSSGIQINYYYRDPSFDPVNKYSVDYENGIVYTYTDMNNEAVIDYKASCYKAAYDIAREVDTYQYDSSANVVSIRTEGLNEVNNLVKLIWTKAPTTSDLVALKEYFTPLINVLAFRFN